MAADEFKWSKVGMRATTRFFKGATTFSLNASFDPYAINVETGRRMDTLIIKTDGKLLSYIRK